MTFSFDKKDWIKALNSIPLNRPSGGVLKKEAMSKPGNCVKSKECEPNGMPKYFGRIANFNDNEVIIISHNDKIFDDFVWRGTQSEYFDSWDCD